jgi:hypothetical protein
MLDTDIGCWMLDNGLWVLDATVKGIGKWNGEIRTAKKAEDGNWEGEKVRSMRVRNQSTEQGIRWTV